MAVGKILHVVPGLACVGNGIAVAARLLAERQAAELVDAREFVRAEDLPLEEKSEIWVHSNWLPEIWCACARVIRAKRPLVRMPHANLDPLRYRFHGWKKRLASPIERWIYRRTARLVVTCEAERDWCRQWGVDAEIEIVDLKSGFHLPPVDVPPFGRPSGGRPVHVLYLGRQHPLKGVAFLEAAVAQLNEAGGGSQIDHSEFPPFSLRLVHDASGGEVERVWNWCDVLCLPTVSENFGLVIAEALERGKPVLTTDGAVAWLPDCGISEGENLRLGYGGRLVCLKGFREGTDAARVALLKTGLRRILR